MALTLTLTREFVISIVIATEIDINATPKQVWGVLADFGSYGQWSNLSKIEGVPQMGTMLAMKMPGMSFGSARYLYNEKITIDTQMEPVQYILTVTRSNLVS